jgi:nitrogen regulatory protein P-II 1
MKKIEASIRPHRLKGVVAQLCRAGVPGLTASEVREFQEGVAERITYRGTEQAIDLLPRVRLEIVAHDDLVERFVALLLECARADGADCPEISILPVLSALRIRTGEIGEAAL